MSQIEEIENKVKDLRNAINEWSRNFERAQDLILDLARILNESGTVGTYEVSGKIKDLLKDEIEKKKVTPRWIEKVLPPEYKHKYTKSELNSLSEPRQIEVANTGEQNVHVRKESLGKELESDQEEHEDIQQDITKSKEYFLEPTSYDTELEQELIFVVLKEKLEEIVDCLRKCRIRCYLTFNVEGTLSTIEPDQ